MAEGIFQHLINAHGLQEQISCDSCGTSAYHIGALADERARKESTRNGITLTHKARQLSVVDFYEFDLILAMDASNYENILMEKPGGEIRAEVKMMRDFDTN